MELKAGDLVRVVGITDLDGDFGPPGTLITDPKHVICRDWQDPTQSWVGQVGYLTEVGMSDYYDVCVRFPWMSERESASFKLADIEIAL